MNKTLSTLGQQRVYLASDFHLGTPSGAASLERERKVVRWLDAVSHDAAAIFLVGDLFDFWFEYRHVIPKGFIRFQGKLAELRDRGIPIYFFTGNHDMWLFDYFTTELGIPIYRDPQAYEIGGRTFLIGHGDGLGPGDYTYKLLRRVFRNPLAQWAFRWLHPNIGFGIATGWSKKSRIANDRKGDPFKGDNEWLLQYCREMEQTTHYDYYIFGHRHLPLDLKVNEGSRYINLGEWVNFCTYVEISEENVELCTFEG